MIHHVRGVEIAAVYHRIKGRDQLNGGDVKALTEGGGGQLSDMELIVGPDITAVLVRQVDARGLHNTEAVEIIVKFLSADLLANGNQGRVTGVAHRLCQSLVSVAAAGGAADGPGVYLHTAAAVKGGIFVNDALLQTGSQHDGLEGRAGLVGVGNGLVGPLGVDCVGIGLLIGLLIGERRLFLLCQLSPLFLGLPDGILHRFLGGRFNLFGLLVHLGKQCGVSDGAVIVQVKVGTHGHAQDGAGIALHCDDHAAVLGLIPGAVLLQIALAICLYGRVDGQVDIIAIFRIVVVLEKVHQVSAHAVFRRDHQAGGAGQLALKLGFQAVGAAAVVGKADDLSGKAGIGIVPLGIGLEIDTAGQMVGVDQFPDLCLHIIFHLLGHPLILAVGVGALFPQAGGVQL